MVEVKDYPKQMPAQHQDKQPGIESEMNPLPIYDDDYYKGSGKLKDRVALITGGDSGIGRSAAILFAKEGADVAIVYVDAEQGDAEVTKKEVEKHGRKCLLIPGDICSSSFCKEAVEKTVKEFGKLTTLVNNAAIQVVQESILDITDEQLDKTFRTNIYSMFYLSRAALPYLEKDPHNSTIINTTSVTCYKGKEVLLDYSSTKGAITAFTRSLSTQLADKGIRVNAVAPGPIWTPLIPATFTEEMVKEFGTNANLGRPGQPIECATAYVFLASRDSSYFTGQVLHPNGGAIVNG